MLLSSLQASRILLLLALLGLFQPAVAEESVPQLRVYIVLVDGLSAKFLSPKLTPVLWELIYGGKERATFYPQARAVMPTTTNVNHVSLMTGTYPAAHGVTGNYYWDRRDRGVSMPLDHAELIEVETLFTVIEKEKKAWVSAGIFGKQKLVNLFRAGESQLHPDHLWSDIEWLADLRTWLTSSSVDGRIMDEVLRIIAQEGPRLLFVSLPTVDFLSHHFGPDSHEARGGILKADHQIGRLVKSLKARGLWQEVVLMLTADHGFASVMPKEGSPYPSFSFGEELAREGIEDVMAVSDGGIEHIYLRDLDPASSTLNKEAAERLKTVRDLALRQPEVEEVLYRLANQQDGEERYCFDTVYTDWRLSHPRVGEMILVARSGYYFNDPFRPGIARWRGYHGSMREQQIPIVITGGYAKIQAQVLQEGEKAANPDLGMTAAWLLGLREPRYVSGEPVPDILQGRVLSEAFVP
jgi:predicted AlkP superfamily pyrophosphatase or phosphodiesterase